MLQESINIEQEISDPNDPTCSQGPQGIPGPQGIQGQQGIQGPQGIQGDVGVTGPQGTQGPQGVKGDTGEVGAIGPVGPQGAKGDTGEVGATGPQGVKGDKGDTGAIGPVGATGPQGLQGIKGDTGAAGPQGVKGDTGTTGPQGPQGPQGVKGESGATAAVATTTTNGLMSSGDKSKLDGVAAGANNYVHPSTHAISQVSGLQTALDGKVNAGAYNGLRSERTNGMWNSDFTMVTPDGVLFGRGRNGILFAQAEISYDGITLPSSAVMDMPGVLRAGRVLSGGGISGNSWGAKPCICARPNGVTGQYQITHNIGHTDYFITTNFATDFDGTIVILSKQNNTVTIGTKGMDNQFHNVPFEFIICGKN